MDLFARELTGQQSRLYAFIFSLLADAEAARDVLQETNRVLWEKRAEFDAGRDFLPWALAYRGDDLAMVLIVPNTIDGLAALDKRLSAEALEAWIGALETRATTVAMPKFRAESYYELNDPLTALGMTDAFDSKKARHRRLP